MDIFFLLKKFITFFVEPFGFVLSLFFVGLFFLYKKKYNVSKIFLSISFSCILLFSYQPFSNFLVKTLENRYVKFDYKDDVRYIHVLGSGHHIDSTQPLSSQITNSGVKRVLEGILIYKKLSNAKIIFTGYDGGTGVSNAKMNAKLAIALGVKESDIIIGENPKDTYEEAQFTKTLLDDGEKFVLVTSATHLVRAMILFKSFGLNPIPAPTDFHKKEYKSIFVAPSIASFKNSRVAIHEYLGILWSFI